MFGLADVNTVAVVELLYQYPPMDNSFVVPESHFHFGFVPVGKWIGGSEYILHEFLKG